MKAMVNVDSVAPLSEVLRLLPDIVQETQKLLTFMSNFREQFNFENEENRTVAKYQLARDTITDFFRLLHSILALELKDRESADELAIVFKQLTPEVRRQVVQNITDLVNAFEESGNIVEITGVASAEASPPNEPVKRRRAAKKKDSPKKKGKKR